MYSFCANKNIVSLFGRFKGKAFPKEEVLDDHKFSKNLMCGGGGGGGVG